MSRYQEEYNRKLTNVEGALSLIQNGDYIATGQVGIEPVEILSKLHTLHGKVENITVLGQMSVSAHEFMDNPDYKNTFHSEGMFLMGGNRASHRAGMTSFIPGHMHNGTEAWVDEHKPRVFISGATPMDEHGYLHISLCLIHEYSTLRTAKEIILEVNPNIPTIYGDTPIHISQVSAIVETNRPIMKLERSPVSELDMTIGRYIAELIHDGDTIQLGIGGIPDAAAAAFMDKHDLGIHTEMIGNTVVDLVEAGVVTGARKTLHKDKITAVFALGDQRLYDFLDRNPSVQMMRSSYVNHPGTIAQNDNMVSINSALAIDLTGQVCSESIGSLQYSGSGGAVDTAVGARHSKGGRSIIAIHSTRNNDTISNIMPQLPLGAVVTLSRNDVGYIVTEYGIAKMFGLCVRDRVRNLIAISHPNFREDMRKAAEKLMLW
jgi:acyl-CoA hydrolase